MEKETDILIERSLSVIITGLTTNQTQMQLSKKMGFKSNQVQRWCSGNQIPSWNQFAGLCEITSTPLPQALEKTFQLRTSPNAQNVVNHLIGLTKLKTFAAAVGFSQSLISKWRYGQAEPNLLQVLLLMERGQSLGLTFLDELFPDQKIKIFNYKRDHRKRLVSVLLKNPQVSVVLAYISLKDKITLPEILNVPFNENLNLPLKNRKDLVEKLIEFGCIKNIDGYLSLDTSRLDTRGDIEINRSLRQYWIECAVRARSSQSMG